MSTKHTPAPELLPESTQTAPAVSSAPELRYYQKDAHDRVIDRLFNSPSNRLLYTLATGTGKTFTAAHIANSVMKRDNRPVLLIAHRQELLEQARGAFKRINPDWEIGMEVGNQKARPSANVVIASIQTIAREGTTRLDWLTPSMIWYDECHHAAADGSLRLLKRMGCFDARKTPLIGCTATAHRLDNKPLSGETDAVFQESVYEYSLLTAIADGFLCDLSGYMVTTETDLSRVGTRAGDFAENEMASAVNNEKRNLLAVKHWKELAEGRPTIAFCASVAHSDDVAEMFRATGVPAESVHGGMKDEERRAVMNRFKAGVTLVLCNCQIATEGFDHPPVSCILMMRPTKSWALYAQMVGRGTRLSPATGKTDCLVLDVVDITGKHDLATLPGMVGIPARANLRGKGVAKAKQELDALGAKAAHIESPTIGQTDFDALLSKARAVNLFTIPRIPDEVAAVGRFRWMSLGGGYYLKFASASCRVQESPLGYQATIKQNGESVLSYVDSSLAGAIRTCESWIRRYRPDAVTFVDTSAHWAKKPPTEKQVFMMQTAAKKAGVVDFTTDGITTAGEASFVISALFEQAKQKTAGVTA